MKNIQKQHAKLTLFEYPYKSVISILAQIFHEQEVTTYNTV